MGRILSKKSLVSLSDIFTQEMLEFYQEDWVAFIEDQILDPAMKELDKDLFLSEQQKEIIRSVQVHKNTSVVTGKGLGKTGVASMIVLTFLSLYDDPKVVITAPSYPQLKSAFWPELALWLKRSNMANVFEYTSERLYNKEEPENWWAEPRTSSKKESMQGLHAIHQLIITDEGSGVPDDIFEAIITTNSLPHNRFLAISNGTSTTGWFFDSQHKNRHLFNCLQFSGEDSPFVDEEYVADLEYRYGREHDIFRVSVLGLFPKGNPDSYISLERVEAANMRDVTPHKNDPIVLGVDVARFGDDSTVIYWRQGDKVYPPDSKEKTSVPDVVEMVQDKVKEIRGITGFVGRITVNVDIGNMGAGVFDYLSLDTENNIEVIDCNFGGKGNNLYANEASMMWGALESTIDKLDLPGDRPTSEEISSRNFSLTYEQRVMISSKRDYKRKYHKSPDRADALVLCIFDKKPAETVVKSFDRLSPKTVVPAINYIGRSERIASIFVNNDMKVSVIYGGWDSHRFYITHELEATGDIGAISHFIRSIGAKKVIGNAIMFGKSSGDVKTSLLRVGVRVTENRSYDEFGATMQLVSMFDSYRVQISSSCTKTIDQLDGWNLKESPQATRNNYGMCYAILNIMSVLRNKMNTRPSTPNYIGDRSYTEKTEDKGVTYNPWLGI